MEEAGVMDLSKAARAEGAAVYRRDQVTAADRAAISEILRTTALGVEQSLRLGSACPYDRYNVHKRAAWTTEIWRQRGYVDDLDV